jgi:hypothetical protein
MILQQPASPILSNDFQGWLTFFGMIAAVLGVVITTIVVLAKRGDREAIKAVDGKVTALQETIAKDINGVGTRLNAMELEAEKAHAELRTEIKGINSTLEGYHHEQTTMILEMARVQTERVHEVDKQVAVLKERSNLVDCIDALGEKVAKAIREYKP